MYTSSLRPHTLQALGALVKSISEDDYKELEKYLLFTMKSDANQVSSKVDSISVDDYKEVSSKLDS